MTGQASFLHRQLPALVGIARLGEVVNGIEISHDVGHLLGLEPGNSDLSNLHCRHHSRRFVPHRGSNEDRRAVLFEEIEVRSDYPPDRGYLMTDDTPLLGEKPFANLCMAGRIEVVERVEERDEVPGLPGSQERTLDLELPHTL